MNDHRTKVLFFIPALVPGGAERVTATLLRNLSRTRFDVSLAVVNQEGSVFSEELPSDIPIIDLKASRLRFALVKILRLIWNIQPDVVFSTIDYLNITLGATRRLWPRRTRFIARPTILFSAALQESRQPSLWRALTKISLASTDLLVFQSPAMERDYRDSLNWHDGAAAVIPNPLDLDFVRKQATSGAEEPDLDPSTFNIVAAGRLEEQKGFDLAIEAVAALRNKDVHLTILGEGSRRTMLESLARKKNVEDRVRLIGYRHNPYPYYAKADGFLLSSKFEGFPNVILEALSCGTPVIATPVAGLSTILENIPQCEISSGHRISELSEAIARFVARGRQRVDSAVIERFDARIIVRRYEELFEKVGSSQARVGRSWSLAR